jgi:hypothetical protein
MKSREDPAKQAQGWFLAPTVLVAAARVGAAAALRRVMRPSARYLKSPPGARAADKLASNVFNGRADASEDLVKQLQGK